MTTGVAAAVVFVAVLAAGVGSASAAVPVPYDGPGWMARVAIIGDSSIETTTPEVKAAARGQWWRDATFSYPGVRIETMRDQLRGMAADRPDAFVVSLGVNDTAALAVGEWDWSHELSQISGVFDDLGRAGVPCTLWVGLNENGQRPGSSAAQINAAVRAQFQARGAGVWLDWTARSAGHPEYFLADGSHLTAAGKAVWSAMIATGLRQCSGNPVGTLDRVSAGVGTVRASGWAFDGDTSTPIDVHVWIDGQPVGATKANRSRPDVGAAYPFAGPSRGYDATFAVAPGSHTVCTYGINAGAYGFRNTLLGCQAVTVTTSPVGSFDTASAIAGGARLTGWAIDPDTSAPIDVHVWVDGHPAAVTRADRSRPDLAAIFPAYGAPHGYQVDVGLAPGVHQVCTYGINAPGTGGGNALLDCRRVTGS